MDNGGYELTNAVVKVILIIIDPLPWSIPSIPGMFMLSDGRSR